MEGVALTEDRDAGSVCRRMARKSRWPRPSPASGKGAGTGIGKGKGTGKGNGTGNGTGKGKGKGKDQKPNIIQIDLSKLPPDLVKEIKDAIVEKGSPAKDQPALRQGGEKKRQPEQKPPAPKETP